MEYHWPTMLEEASWLQEQIGSGKWDHKHSRQSVGLVWNVRGENGQVNELIDEIERYKLVLSAWMKQK